MKTLKTLFLIVLVSLTFASCGTKESTKEVVSTASVAEVPVEKSDFPGINSPALFGGPDGFGKAFLGFIVYQKYDIALKFTSKESIEKFGTEAILTKYKSFSRSYKLEKSSESIDGVYTILRYKTKDIATSVTKDFKVVIENDSCKLVLPDKLDDLLK